MPRTPACSRDGQVLEDHFIIQKPFNRIVPIGLCVVDIMSMLLSILASMVRETSGRCHNTSGHHLARNHYDFIELRVIILIIVENVTCVTS